MVADAAVLRTRTAALRSVGRCVHVMPGEPVGGDRVPAFRLGGGAGRSGDGNASNLGLR